MELINDETKQFLNPFCPTDLANDPLPIKVYRNSISKDEAVGQAIHWTFEYLFQRNCPTHLMDFVLGCVREDVKNKIVPQFEILPGESEDAVDESGTQGQDTSREPLNLMHTVIKTVDDFLVKIKDVQDDIALKERYPEVYEKGRKWGLPGAGQLASHHVSYYSMKNQRRSMEDKLVVFPHLQEIFDLDRYMSYFAVFDGHNGAEAAAYAAAQLHQILIEQLKGNCDVKEALSTAFKRTDEMFLEKCKSEKIRSGTTVVSVVMDQDKLYIAWVGDSQAALISGEGSTKQLVISHKPDREDERQRILSMGGEVMDMSGTWRVNGNLAVSRSLGDVDYKHVVISTPEILELDAKNLAGEYIVLASDGLWDVMDELQVKTFVDQMILADKGLDAAQFLALEAKRKGSTDNITVIVVFLQPMESLKLVGERCNKHLDMMQPGESTVQETERNENLIMEVDGSFNEYQAKENGFNNLDLVDFSHPDLDSELKEDAGAFSEPDEEWSFQPPPKVNADTPKDEFSTDDRILLTNTGGFSVEPEIIELSNHGIVENECVTDSEHNMHVLPQEKIVIPETNALVDLEVNDYTQQSTIHLDLNAGNLGEIQASILDAPEDLIGGFNDQVLQPVHFESNSDSFSLGTAHSVTELPKMENLVDSGLDGIHDTGPNIGEIESRLSETLKLETNAVEPQVKNVFENIDQAELEGNIEVALGVPLIESNGVEVVNAGHSHDVEQQAENSSEERFVPILEAQSVPQSTEKSPLASPKSANPGVAAKSPVRVETSARGVKKSDPPVTGVKSRTPSPLKGTKTGVIKNQIAPPAVVKRTALEKASVSKLKPDGDVKPAARSNKPAVSQTGVKEISKPTKTIAAKPLSQAKLLPSKVSTKPVGQLEPKANAIGIKAKPTPRPLSTKAVPSAVSPTKPGPAEVKGTATTLKSRTQPITTKTTASKVGVTGQDGKIVSTKVPAKPLVSTSTVKQASKPLPNGTSTTATGPTRSARPATARPLPTRPVVNTTGTIPASRPTTARVPGAGTARPMATTKVPTGTGKPEAKGLSSKPLVKPILKAVPSKIAPSVAKKAEGTKSDAPKKVVNGVGGKETTGKREPSKNAVEKKVSPKKVAEGVLLIEPKSNDVNSQGNEKVGISENLNMNDVNGLDNFFTKPENGKSDPFDLDANQQEGVNNIEEQVKLLDLGEPGLRIEVTDNPAITLENNGGQEKMELNPVVEGIDLMS